MRRAAHAFPALPLLAALTVLLAVPAPLSAGQVHGTRAADAAAAMAASAHGAETPAEDCCPPVDGHCAGGGCSVVPGCSAAPGAPARASGLDADLSSGARLTHEVSAPDSPDPGRTVPPPRG